MPAGLSVASSRRRALLGSTALVAVSFVVAAALSATPAMAQVGGNGTDGRPYNAGVNPGVGGAGGNTGDAVPAGFGGPGGAAPGGPGTGPYPGTAQPSGAGGGGGAQSGGAGGAVAGNSGGGGGGGGTATTKSNTHTQAVNSTGGNGGNGGLGSATGAGGGGGGGGNGIYFSSTNILTINPGVAVQGGTGGQGGGTDSNAGTGGGGGDGGNGVRIDQNGAITNTGTINGGRGGDAAVTNTAGSANGGAGGAGILFTSAATGGAVINSNVIRGGDAGTQGDPANPAVAGGAGIVGAGLNIVNGGLIAGGLGSDGVRADAVTFTGGTNMLNLAGATSGMSGNIGIAGGSLALTSNGDVAVSNVITGAGALSVASNNNVVTLSGTNTYSGGTTLTAGTLNVSADNNLGAATGGVALDGGRLQFGASFNLASTRAVSLESSSTFDTNGFDTSVAAPITGFATLTKAGTGTMTVTGANTYTGGTTISAGTFQVGDGGTTGSITGNVVNDATLVFNRSNASTFSGVIGGLGNLQKQGAGTLTLTNNNIYSGGTTITGGALQIGNGGATGSITGNVTNLSTLIFNRANDLTFAGNISGGSVQKQGAGTLTLTGTSAAGTNIMAGRLQVGNGGAAGTITGNVVNNAALAFNRSDAVIYAGIISGSGTVEKLGGGTLTLSGANTYSGGTTLSDGTLNVSANNNLGASSGSLTFAGGTLQLGASFNLASTRAVSLGVGGGTVDTNSFDMTVASSIGGAGALTKTGAGTLSLTGTNTYSGGTTISAGTLLVGIGVNGSITGNVTNNGTLAFARFDDITYGDVVSGTGSLRKNNSGTLTLTNDNTYTGGTTVSGGTLQIGNGGTTGSIAGNVVTNSNLAFNRSNDLTFAGDITGSGTVQKLGAGTLTLTGTNVYGVTTVSAGTLQIGDGGTAGSVIGNIINNANVAFNRSDALTYVSTISGTGTMEKLGAGTLSLTGANTYTGVTTVSDGTLQIGSGSPIAGAATLASDVVNNAALVFNNAADSTYAGDISGSGTLTKLTNGSVILTGDVTHTGGTTITRGALRIGNGGTTGSITGNIVNNGSLIFNRSDAASFAGDVSGTGQLLKTGAGTLTLTGTNTHSGGTTVAGGTVQIGNGGTSGSVAGNISNTGTVVFNRSNDLTYGGVISSSGRLEKLGAGTLTLTGANTYGGVTTITAGTLQIGNGGTTGSITDNVVNNANMVFNRSDNLTFSGVVSGTGSLDKLGAGMLTLKSANTYTGVTTVSAGTLRLLDTGSIAGDIVNNATLAFAPSGDTTYAGEISGTGAVQKTGSTVILTGTNTYTGGTTISTGTLQIGNGGTTGSVNGNIVANSRLVFNRSDAVTFAGDVSGIGAMQKLGAGTLTLTGTNTNTGFTFVTDGALQIGNGGTTGSVAGKIANNDTLIFNRSDDVTHAGLIGGGGTVQKLGAGTLTLTDANSYSGMTTINAGTLQIGNGGTTGSIFGNVTNNAALAFNRSDALNYAGAVSGTGSLQKLGAGILTLSGASTYTGATTVNGGALSVNGSIASSVLTTVNSGATLGGTGTVGNTVIAAGGTLAAGNSIGTLTVNGTLGFNAASTYAVEVSPADADRTNVTGIASLGGATVNASFAPGSYLSRRYTILNAGGIAGTFGALTNTGMPASVTDSLSYDLNNVYLDVVLNFAGPSFPNELTGNPRNVADVLTGYFNRTGGIPMAFAALDANGLAQAAGQPGAAVPQAGIDATRQFVNAVFDGAFDAGSGQGGVASYAPQRNVSRDAKDAYAAVTPRDRLATFDRRWNVWASAYGGNSRINGDAGLGSSTTTNRVFGTTAGATYRFSPQTQLGLALGGAGHSFSLDGGFGSGKADVFNAAVYGKHEFGAAYVAGLLGYSWQDTTTDRNVVSEALHASFKAQAFATRLEGGWRYATPSFGITPYAALQTTTFYLPSYGETATSGPGIFALNYDSKNVTATRGELGAKADKTMLVQGGIVTFKGKAAWAHDWNNERSAIATFQQLPGATFTTNAAQPAANAALVSLGAEMKWHNGWTLAGSVDGEFSRSTVSYAGKGSIKYAW